MSDQEGRQPVDYFAAVTVVAVLLLLLAGWWLFPKLQDWLSREDCIATFRTNCGLTPASH